MKYSQNYGKPETDSGRAEKPEKSEGVEHKSPDFDYNHSGDVTAVLGKTALLNCRVKNIGNKTVSLVSFPVLYLKTGSCYISWGWVVFAYFSTQFCEKS